MNYHVKLFYKLNGKKLTMIYSIVKGMHIITKLLI